MLENSFIHLPDCTPRTERRLWERGICDWDAFLDHFGGSAAHKAYCAHLARSKFALRHGDAAYFARAIPRNEAWRCFPHFDRIAYLDIETTGLSAQDNHLTVIGVFDGKRTHSYIQGINLGEFATDIAKYRMVVTFNGSRFDLPFLRKAIPEAPLPELHIDMYWLLASLNVRGGLKRIEEQFGLKREGDLAGLTGYDAVKLWKQHVESGDREALDRLVRYNAADIGNLKKLLEWAYAEKRKQTGLDEILGRSS